MHIRVNFLGNPRIYIDKKELFISKNKLRLLFLYILYKENCTRDELTDLFWEDLEENKGKANLRNTLYELKKLLPKGLLKIEGHDYVGIYKNVILDKDIDIFLQGNNESQLFELKESIFMEKIIARNNNNYNEWVQTTRGAYSGILLSSLESQLSRSMASKNNPRIREIANRILELDPVHEMAYQELIKLAIYNHSYNVGWKLYRQITLLVREELGAEPEEKTLALAEVLRSKERQSQGEKEMYFERLDLIIALKKQYEAFANGERYQNIVVQGELGSGKSYVVSRLMEEVKNAEVLNLSPNDEKTRGRALDLLAQSEHFVLREGVLHLAISEPMVLRIQNLQYMDLFSAQEIFHNLAHRGEALLIVAELSLSELNNQALRDFLERENLLVLEVPLLSLEQMVDYIQGLSQKVDPLSFGAIYEKSRGNMLMIHHELSGTQPREQGERVYHSLSQKERSLLQKIALFYHGVSRGSLAKISAFTMEENLNLLSNLLQKGILVYEDGFRFKYPIYQQIVRCHMEPGIVTQYHQILAQALQPEAKTFDQLEEILYQYQQGNQVMEALGVELRLLRIKLDFTDQLFPLLKAPHELKGVSAMDPFDVYQEFDRLSQGLQNLQGRMPYDEYAQKQMEILFLKGRTMIAGGRAEEGLGHILELVERASKAKAANYLIKAWGEQIHYGIHREDYVLMKEALDLGKSEIEKAQSALKEGEEAWGEELYLAKAEFTRLEGLYYLRTGALDRSIELLQTSIGYYDLPRYEGHSIIPIAAAYHYMGELYALQSDYDKSKTYFEKSIATIEKHHLTKSLDIFYGDYGHLLYELGEKTQAKTMLDQSLYYYEQTGNHWKRALVESLLGLIALEENNREKAMAHMRNGEIFFQKDQRKLEEKYLEELKLSLKNISISTR